jgi:hypothetical protein
MDEAALKEKKNKRNNILHDIRRRKHVESMAVPEKKIA